MPRISSFANDIAAGATQTFIGAKRAARAPSETTRRRAGQIIALASGVVARIGRDGRLRHGAAALSKSDDHMLRDIGLDRLETLYAVRFGRSPAGGLP